MSDNLKYSFDEDNIAELRKNKVSCNKGEKVYRMVNRGPAPCKVKVSDESRRICAKSLLK